MRRAALLIVLLAGALVSIAAADVYAPDPWRMGPGPRIPVERRWWLEAGLAFPDRQGTTGFWQTGFGLGGGIEFPVAGSDGVFVRAHSAILPLRGTTSIGDTLSGESWTLEALTVGAHHRFALWRNSPSVRVFAGIEAGGALQHFGRVDQHGPYANQTESSRDESGMLVGFGAGLEVAPEHSLGGFAEARFNWFSGGAIYTWSTIDAGVTFPW